MHSAIIKLRYGLTIDENNQCYEPCPQCGGVVCHVKENKHDVFCTKSFCTFKDKYNYDYDDYKIKAFNKSLRYGNIFFRRNANYPEAIHPFMIKEEAESGKFIVREFEVDTVEYNSEVARYCGLGKGSCYKKDSRVIAKYTSIELLANDGWIADCDIDPDRF